MFKYKVATRTCPQCSFKWVEDLSQWVQSLQKVDFFWINRDQKSFEWFLNLLIGMYNECIIFFFAFLEEINANITLYALSLFVCRKINCCLLTNILGFLTNFNGTLL